MRPTEHYSPAFADVFKAADMSIQPLKSFLPTLMADKHIEASSDATADHERIDCVSIPVHKIMSHCRVVSCLFELVLEVH